MNDTEYLIIFQNLRMAGNTFDRFRTYLSEKDISFSSIKNSGHMFIVTRNLKLRFISQAQAYESTIGFRGTTVSGYTFERLLDSYEVKKEYPELDEFMRELFPKKRAEWRLYVRDRTKG